MAGMFYSLEEAAEKLNTTAEQVKELVKQGRLREFRDGSNVLFKIDEVEALMSDTSIMASEETSAEPEQEIGEDEISLASEATEDTATASELTDADTAVTGDEIDVLAEADSEQPPADDTMAETKGTTAETSLEDIEEDVNLDTFGSGSGLLDLSLQADDTSLGGILDEIYTPEGGEDRQAPKGQAAEAGSATGVAADAEEMLPGEELVGPQPAPEAPIMAQAYAEPEPDMQSKTFGIMLFLPLLVLVYTAIVAVAGLRGVMPGILATMQGIIWYVLLVAVVAAVAMAIGPFMLAGKAGKKQKTKTPAELSLEEEAT